MNTHYLGKWEGLGLGILEFFGPQMALAYQHYAVSQGPKNLDIQGPTPSNCLRNGYARIQTIMHGAV